MRFWGLRRYMGTWGVGNFESDGAHEYLLKLLRTLIGEIELKLTDENVERSDFLDAFGECEIIPAIDICTQLSKLYDTALDIDLAEVKRWRQRYLSAFDRNPSNYLPDFWAKRREVIVNTFNELEKATFD